MNSISQHRRCNENWRRYRRRHTNANTYNTNLQRRRTFIYVATLLLTTILAVTNITMPSSNNAQRRIGVVVMASVTPDTGMTVTGNSTTTTDHSNERHTLPNSSSNDNNIEDDITNPYTDGGCLYQLMPGWTRKRVCTSADPPEFVEMGYCERDSVFNYPEIRISSQNWESVFFTTWIVQVILSEMLGVPTTVETGLPDVVVDLYDPHSRVEYGLTDDFECLERANDVGDCRLLHQSNTGVDGEYKSCCHFIPEVWDSDTSKLDRLQEKDVIEQAAGVGTIGEQRWFVPKVRSKRVYAVIIGWCCASGFPSTNSLILRILFLFFYSLLQFEILHC